MDWVVIKTFGEKPIGAIGFIRNKVAVITSFYEDEDGNEDGEVSVGEWLASKVSPISVKGMAITKVAMAARNDMRVIGKDESFYTDALKIYLSFATGLVVQGIYAAYFSRAVGKIGGIAAEKMTSGLVKQYAIKKGFEEAVKQAVEGAVPALSS